MDTTPPPLEEVAPPPPPENVGPPLEPWKRMVNIPDGPEPLPPPEENSWIRAWSSDDQLMIIAAVEKGVIPVAHVYALHREIPPFPAGRVRGPCADAGISFRGIQVHLT